MSRAMELLQLASGFAESTNVGATNEVISKPRKRGSGPVTPRSFFAGLETEMIGMLLTIVVDYEGQVNKAIAELGDVDQTPFRAVGQALAKVQTVIDGPLRKATVKAAKSTG